MQLNPVRPSRPGDPNYEPVDRYTILHVLVGAGVAYFDVRPLPALAIFIGWEFLERPLKQVAPHIFPDASQDTLANAVTDVAANMVGYQVAREAFGAARAKEDRDLARRGRAVAEALAKASRR